MDALVHDTILDDMDDGVVSVALDGKVVSVNAAAARILGMERSQVEGRSFGEAFVALEGLDAFTETVFDAVGEKRNVGRKAIEIRTGGERRLINISTSWLHAGSGPDSRRTGIVAVFSDITEIQELRETEIRLGEQVKEQYAELQTAYRQIEESNRELSSTLRRVQVIKAIATGTVLAICLGAGYYAWQGTRGAVVAASTATVTTAAAEGGEPLATMIVQPQHLLSAVSFPGRLAARQETNIISPIPGTVGALHFQYGDEVEQGQVLLELDTSTIAQEHRATRAQYIEAIKRVQELDNWENGPETLAARRALDRSRRALDSQQRKIEQTAFLLESGVIPALEHETAMERYENLQAEQSAAEVNLQAVRERGGAAAREVASLELQTVEERLREIETAMTHATVRSPVSGIVMQPAQERSGFAGQSGGAGRLLEGTPVSPGQLLLRVSDIDSLSVEGFVDEVEVAKLRVGQPVTVTGDAFPGVALAGALSSVSPQAVDALSRRQPASFSFAAALDAFDPEVRQLLRLGMSVDVEVVIQDMPRALLVPLHAVQRRSGSLSVRVLDRATGQVRSIEVETGATTRDSVHVTRGLEAGDEVVLGDGPGRRPG